MHIVRILEKSNGVGNKFGNALLSHKTYLVKRAQLTLLDSVCHINIKGLVMGLSGKW